jgi:hypothetical protein
MAKRAALPALNRSMDLLSRLLLPAASGYEAFAHAMEEQKRDVLSLTRSDFDELAALASSNHVIVRALEVFRRLAQDVHDETRAAWAEEALAAERARIAAALPVLQSICADFEEQGYSAAVIKSLDHWPDLGSDLDLYTDANPSDVAKLMKARFDARVAARSWGDRLAQKWNFLIPELREAVEIHFGRLGQTGEQVGMAASLMRRTRTVTVSGLEFRVPSIFDRLMISTLQRMYRHFYFRLCDIIDTTALAATEGIDYAGLRSAASAAEIWEGVATYLVIVSDYVKRYRGSGIDLPEFVMSAARFDGNTIYYAREFLRVPILPQSAGLYASQLAGMLRKRELLNGARLSLLPWLATAAVVGQKITGSDKGIW